LLLLNADRERAFDPFLDLEPVDPFPDLDPVELSVFHAKLTVSFEVRTLTRGAGG